MKLSRKNAGQASTEYLVILAIAIIIAIVVVSLLSGFIKVGGTSSTKATKTYWKSSDIAIPSWALRDQSASGDSSFVVQNNLEYKINLDIINLTNAAGTSYTVSLQRVLAPGEQYQFTTYVINCSTTGGGSGVGSGYSFDVYFRYDNLDDGINDEEFTGLQKLTGNCR